MIAIHRLLSPLLLGIAPLGAANAGAPAPRPSGDPASDDLTSKSLEELMQIDITVASKAKQRLATVPAAVYVIGGDEIRRAGHASIQEALRMVPGFYVSHWAGDAWDVTSRGFGPGLSLTSQAYLNQLLVMIDGVVVYSPLFAGTWWPLHDPNLADVDRIEVVRGPGGLLWGSNAVHGVVHIITKHAADTQGPQLTLRGANDDRHGTLRFGDALGENGHYRVWVKRSEYDTPSNPFDGFDEAWNLNSGGMRADWSHDGKEYTFLMRGYDGSFDYRAFDLTLFVPYRDTSNKYGVQVFGSVKDPESGSELRGWLYHDQQDLPTLLDQRIDTADVEYNRSLELSERTTLLVGAGYRVIRSTLVGEDPTYLSFDPESFTQNIFRAFAIGTTNLTDEVQLTAGMTLEHNDFTQFEFQPTARATWTPCADWMTWASISRAVRTPSLEEQTLSDISLYAGNESFLAEVLWAYEIGTRKMFGERVSTDLALFYNDYDNLHYAEFNGAGYDLTNKAQGSAWGSELALDVQPADWWRLRSAFSILHSKRDVDGVALMTDDYHPERLFNVRSYVDLGDDWELDSALYAVGRMGPGYEIAEYTRVDVRLGWTPTDSLELYAGVQDVGHATRSEYDEFDNPRRSVYFGLSWQPE